MMSIFQSFGYAGIDFFLTILSSMFGAIFSKVEYPNFILNAENGIRVILAFLSEAIMTTSATSETLTVFREGNSPLGLVSELARKLEPLKESGIMIEILMSASSMANDLKNKLTAAFDAQ